MQLERGWRSQCITVALTLSRAAPLPSGIGILKCYDVDVTGAIENRAIDTHSLLERTYEPHD
jgi:hypothetical protein